VACGACANVCPTSALEISGKQTTVEEALAEVMKDKVFYDNSGGGITISGGEPMAQFDFTKELLKKSKESGLHTAIETCGFAPTERYLEILPLVDLFLFDWKITDRELHKQYTGSDNALIEKNLRYLSDTGAKIILRCPIIPTVNDNDSHFEGIARLANDLDGILSVDIEPYHPLGIGKVKRLGREPAFCDLGIPEKEMTEGWIKKIKKMTTKDVKKA
jgi:pyruvate formate lyase activating enzyme